MEGIEEGVKTKTLAVFQNVVTKEKQKKRKKFRTHRFSDEDSSPSESELVIDDEAKDEVTKRKRSGVRIRFKEEALNMKCQWNSCLEVLTDTQTFFKHLVGHVDNVNDDLNCKWTDCPNPTGLVSVPKLLCHIAYHGYLAKLINIGENVLERNNLPDCTLGTNYTIEISENGYTCYWTECNFTFGTIFDYLSHVECHVNGAPSGKEVDFSDVIPCLWSGCGEKFSTRYKLGDHLRVHTKERMIACPKCMSLFSTKTTFCDHRKRQLKTHLRSYQCSQCLKLFSSERILSDHMRSHINQYKCTLCDMTSTKPSMLAKHYRYRHMNVRPFSCPHCQKTFVTKSNLNTHILTHQDKPFKCDQCEFGCKSKVGLASHVLKVHGIEKSFYECQVCKILFRRGDYLTKHLIKIHKFHWPSGHSRFRYRKDSDGVCRLQTVRYESLEVTEEMIKSESMKPVKNPSAVTYNVTYDKNEANGYKLTISQENYQSYNNETPGGKDLKEEIENKEIIISIEDLDDKGNVIKRQEIGSDEIFLFGPDEAYQDGKIENVASVLVDEYKPDI